MTSWITNLWNKNKELQTPAEVATERLRMLLVTNQTARMSSRLTPDRLSEMKLEIAQVVGKYIGVVQSDDIKIEQRKEEDMDVLELSISLNDVKD